MLSVNFRVRFDGEIETGLNKTGAQTCLAPDGF